jgi:hypothetical protein
MTRIGAKQFQVGMQIAFGFVLGVGILWAWLDSSLPLWEVRSPDGSYLLGWRSAIVALSVLPGSQCISFLIFKELTRLLSKRPLKI